VLSHGLGAAQAQARRAVSGRASPFSTGAKGLTGQPVACGEKTPSPLSLLQISQVTKISHFFNISTTSTLQQNYTLHNYYNTIQEKGNSARKFTHKFVQIFITSIVQVFNIKVMKQKQL
jgi:hypothetical protein